MKEITFDDLVAFIARDPALSAASSRASIERLHECSRYDLGELVESIPKEEIERLVGEHMSPDGKVRLTFGGDNPKLLIRWTSGEMTWFVSWHALETDAFFWLTDGMKWRTARDSDNAMWASLRSVMKGVVVLIQEAEANHDMNVEFVDREESSPGGTPARLRWPSKRIRTISLTATRKQYLGGSTPHQGGTHARPCEHVRVLTERTITPKGRKPYVRKAKVITINAGVRRETKVVL